MCRYKKNLESIVDKDSIIENWREEKSVRQLKSPPEDSMEKQSEEESEEKPVEIQVKEPEFAPEESVRLPIIKQNTNIKNIMNHDIYRQNSENRGGVKTLRTNTSVPEITFRHNAITSVGKSSNRSSLHSHTKSQVSIFKERYDKNLNNYLSSLDFLRDNRKNASSAMSMLMSPNYSASKSKKYDL